MDYWPTIDRCSWELPEFYTLLRRGIEWCIDPVDAASEAARAEAAANAPEL
jgi:hypothetical protein